MKRSRSTSLLVFIYMLFACGVENQSIELESVQDPKDGPLVVVEVGRDGAVSIGGENVDLSALADIQLEPDSTIQVIAHREAPSEVLVQVMEHFAVGNESVAIGMQPEE